MLGIDDIVYMYTYMNIKTLGIHDAAIVDEKRWLD